MIVVDLINDEAPLFSRGVNFLISEKIFTNNQVIGITEGGRWRSEIKNFNCVNRLHFFDELDKKEIDINSEIRRISKLYDNFNVYACDRYLINEKRSYQIKMLVYTYLFYEEIFKKDISHYFTTGIAYTYNLVSYQVAQRFDVKHISFYGIRLKNRTAICLGIRNSFEEVNSLYSEFSSNVVSDKMLDSISEFLNKPKQPIYMNNAINATTIKWVFIKEFFIRANKYYFEQKHKLDLFTRNPFELSSFKIKKIIKAKRINLYHDDIFDHVDYDENYYLFPLHMQPEASTMVLAPFYVDQKSAIINVSKVLPLDTILYVKEHRSALGQNSLNFYNELKKYPNIKLISYKENTFELIKRCKGTINLSSTVGLESLILKKPSIVLGDVFYNDSGLTYKVNSYKELDYLLNHLYLTNDVKSNDSDYDNRLAFYLYCLEKKSYPFEFNVAKLDTKKRVLEENNIIEFSNCLKSIIFSE